MFIKGRYTDIYVMCLIGGSAAVVRISPLCSFFCSVVFFLQKGFQNQNSKLKIVRSHSRAQKPKIKIQKSLNQNRLKADNSCLGKRLYEPSAKLKIPNSKTAVSKCVKVKMCHFRFRMSRKPLYKIYIFNI